LPKPFFAVPKVIAYRGWAVTFGTTKRGFGKCQSIPSFTAVPNVTTYPLRAKIPNS